MPRSTKFVRIWIHWWNTVANRLWKSAVWSSFPFIWKKPLDCEKAQSDFHYHNWKTPLDCEKAQSDHHYAIIRQFFVFVINREIEGFPLFHFVFCCLSSFINLPYYVSSNNFLWCFFATLRVKLRCSYAEIFFLALACLLTLAFLINPVLSYFILFSDKLFLFTWCVLKIE